MAKLRDIINNSKRVLRVASKPEKDEFLLTSKICAAGLALIGAIGFVIFIIFILLGI